MNPYISVRITGSVIQSINLTGHGCNAHVKELLILTQGKGSSHPTSSREQYRLKPPGFSSGS